MKVRGAGVYVTRDAVGIAVAGETGTDTEERAIGDLGPEALAELFSLFFSLFERFDIVAVYGSRTDVDVLFDTAAGLTDAVPVYVQREDIRQRICKSARPRNIRILEAAHALHEGVVGRAASDVEAWAVATLEAAARLETGEGLRPHGNA